MATWSDIVTANKSIKPTDVKGKDYAEVNQRIKAFRMVYPEGTISTEILEMANGIITMKASVYDGDKLLGTGTAQEKESSSFINKTSYIENCETSAVGRALGMCGFGIDVSVSSADEVKNAIHQQENSEEQKMIDAANNMPIDAPKVATLKALIEEKGVQESAVLKRYHVDSVDKLNFLQWSQAMKALQATKK